VRHIKAAVLAFAALAGIEAQAQQAGPPPVDESLAPYADTADAVRLPDGRMLQFVCMGEGSPTVILTAGMGDFGGVAWSGVQPAMAKTTRVCAWDRPGFGLSDGSPQPPTVATTTADLEAALAGGTIPGPYVLVGHSLGSYETLLFADRHPDQVAGMVLVDPSVPDQFALLRRVAPDMAASSQQNPLIGILRGCAADIRNGTLRLGGPDPRNCVAYPPTWPAALRDALAAKVIGNPLQYETIASFLPTIEVNSTIVINSQRNYGDMPLVVLTATEQPPQPGMSDEQKAQNAVFAEAFAGAHDDLAALSTRGINARVPGSNHYIQRSKPQVVIDAVEAVVAEARGAAR
jgi:pimeloyl-ACP methyl ester carboxylesterase